MRLEQVEYVVAVARTGSLRQAAEELGLSKPALSEGIARLETELGARLLDRKRSGARLSRIGRDLLPVMGELIEVAERLRTAAGRDPVAANAIRFGTVNTAAAPLVTPALRALQELHPNSAVEIVTADHASTIRALDEGSLDLGLVNILEGETVPRYVRATFLAACHPVAVVPRGHRLASAGSVTAEALRHERFIMMREGFLMNRFTHRYFGRTPPPKWHISDGGEIGKMMVAQGLGVTILPEFSVAGDPLEEAGLIVRVPLTEPTPLVRLVLLEPRDATLIRAAQELREILVRAAEQM